MTTVTVQQDIDVPAKQAWAVLADFGGFLNWAGGGEGTIKVEGSGVGMVRHMDLPGLGKLGERLDVLDHDNMILGYSLVYGDATGMTEYSAQVRLEEKGPETTKILWLGEYRAAEGVDPAAGVMTLDAAYKGMSQGLAAYVKEAV